MCPLPSNPVQALYLESQETKGALTGAPTLPSPSARCARVVILVPVQVASNTAAPPPFRHTQEHQTTLRAPTQDIALHALSAPSCLVILTSKLSPRVLSALKTHRSWTNGCANSLRERQLYRSTVIRSTPTLPYQIGRPTPHLGYPTVVEEVVGASRGFVFASESVLASAVTRGLGKVMLGVYPSALRIRFLLSETDGISGRLAIRLGFSPNMGSLRTGPLKGRW